MNGFSPENGKRSHRTGGGCPPCPPGRLRVLFLSDAIASRNGVGSYYADLVGHLKDFLAHAELVSPGTDAADPAPAISFPLPGDATQRLYWPRASWIWGKIKTAAPHVVVVPTPGPYGLLGFFIARYLGIPLCAAYHTRYEKLTEVYWTSVFSGLSRLSMKGLNRLLFRLSQQVVGTSEEMIAEAERDGAERVRVIGTPIAGSFLMPPFAPLSRQLASVCYAGRLAGEKNIGDILAAARELSHIRFVIAGDGPMREEVAAQAKRCANIEYVGWVSRERVRTIIDDVDMLLLPSEEESFGTIALEAMARRRLVLVSGNCGILNWPELAAGVYAIAPREPLAEAIARVSAAAYPDRLQKADTAHRAAKAFNERTVTQWLELFGDILSRRGRAGENAKRKA